MALIAFERPLSLEEAVDAIVQAALAGSAVSDAAREYAHQVDDRDIYEVVADGLAARAHSKLAAQRRAVPEEAERALESEVAVGSPARKARPAAAKLYWALRANYEAADGTRKALLKFTLDDALNLRLVAAGKADGWVRVRDAMDRATSALRQHGAATIDALPAAEKQAINRRLA